MELTKSEMNEQLKAANLFESCKLKVVVDAEGKKHIEADCQTKEAGHELADLLEREVVIRVKPVKVTEVS